MLLWSTGGLAVIRPLLDTEASSEEYPCNDHGCGCKSAEGCRAHCCCFGTAPPSADVSGNRAAAVPYATSIKSPCCAGQILVSSPESAPWLLHVDRFTLLPEGAGRHDCVDIVIPEDPLLPPVPPPPRSC